MHFLHVALTVCAVAGIICDAFVHVPHAGVVPPRVQSAASDSAGCSRPTRADCCQKHGRQQRCGVQLSAEESPVDAPGLPPYSSLPGMKTVVETEEEEQARVAREWLDDGRRGRVLVRRNEIPSPNLSPAEACRIVFQSLQNNDDPMLDYGAAVAIKFASSLNAVSKMTPADYGDFLRDDPEYKLLLDSSSVRPTAKAKASPDGKQMLQSIEVVGTYPEVIKRLVNVQLSKEDDCWKIDAITFEPSAP